VTSPSAREQHRGGKRLPHRRLGCRLAIAALVQQRPGAVGAHRYGVVVDPHYEKLLPDGRRWLLLFGLLILGFGCAGKRTSCYRGSALAQSLSHRIAVIQS